MQINRHDLSRSDSQKQSGRYRRDDDQLQEKTETQIAELPPHGSYGHLLFDPRWRAKRSEIMARDKGCCIICQSTEELLVHHRQYQFVKHDNAFKVPWDYADHLLITLCKSCHSRGHSKFKIPILIV